MNKNKIQVSIVVPAYREENHIEKTLLDIKNVMDEISSRYEIICIVDGILDKTLDYSLLVAKKYPAKVKVFAYRKNRGKGFALRFGFKLAEGEAVGFIDADGQIKPEALKTALTEFKKRDTDIVIGSKKHNLSRVSYSLLRKLISTLSQLFIRVLFRIGVEDTQAGLKIFKKDAIKDILPRLTVDRFAIDIEILSVARYLGYKNIREIPIKVIKLKLKDKNFEERISFSDLVETFWSSVLIFYRLRVINYYSLKNAKKWTPFIEPELQSSP